MTGTPGTGRKPESLTVISTGTYLWLINNPESFLICRKHPPASKHVAAVSKAVFAEPSRPTSLSISRSKICAQADCQCLAHEKRIIICNIEMFRLNLYRPSSQR
ncbi:MAG: hypothetical protein WAW08_07085, partial [Candidatus Microthrix parvicella]